MKRVKSEDQGTAKKPKLKKCSSQIYPIGTKIVKPFDGVPFNGVVQSYDGKSKFYQVVYEDGDEEELDEKEVRRYGAKLKKIKKEDGNGRKFGVADGKIKDVLKIDTNIFLRNPCRVEGGQQHHPTEYGHSGTDKPINSYYYLVQRISDRNYSMKEVCMDNLGAEYTFFKKPRVINKCVAFLPKTNLNDHYGNPKVVDACHLDLICPKTGDCFLTAGNLLKAVTPNTECIFINGYQVGGFGGKSKNDVDPNSIVKAIDTCKNNLICFSLTETVLTNEILNALSKCKKLKGLTILMTQDCDRDGCTVPSDSGLKIVLTACNNLRWLYVDENSMVFRDECWEALNTNDVCPDLEVLWVNSTKNTEDRHHVAWGDHDIIRKVLKDRVSTLQICMINPDHNVKSRFVLGGHKKSDRLAGEEIASTGED